MNIIIRNAKKTDIKIVFELIKKIAIYEKRPTEVELSEAQLRKDGFGKNPAYKLIVAEANGTVIGFGMYYPTYSSWKGRSLYLHELFVEEKYRNKGVGKKIFEKIVRIAKKEKVGRLEWRVLNWNTPAIELYKKYNTLIENEWLKCELTKKQLNTLT